jgi:protein-L-isoaspartate(D-aspartate) O-methyltransferase
LQQNYFNGCKMFDFAQARTNMVDSQLRPNGITDGRILEAMQVVKREDYVPEGQRTIAYMDEDVPLSGGRFMIEPMAFARMLQVAQVKPQDRVLVVGTATGYGAAVLSLLAASVVAVESDAGLAALARENLANLAKVSVMEGDLAAGCAKNGAFDLIVIEGRVEQVPEALFAQLANGGRIVAALGGQEMAKCCIWTVSGPKRAQRAAFDMTIAPLPGFGKPRPAFAF